MLFSEKAKSVIFSPQADSNLTPNLDIENFSEISLEDQQNLESCLNSSTQQLNTPFYNPLEGLDGVPAQLKLNQDDGYQQTQTGNTEQNFNRFPTTADLTASFSQLPAVASTVFSTFSSIIKGTTQTGTVDGSADSQLNLPAQVQPQSQYPKTTLDELYDYQNLNQRFVYVLSLIILYF